MKRTAVLLLCLFSFAGCSENNEQNNAQVMIERIDPAGGAAPQNSFGFSEAMEPGLDLFGTDAPAARDIAVSEVIAADVEEVPSSQPEIQTADSSQQIAYSYGFGFQIAEDSIAALQKQHVAMCEKIRPACRVIRISQATSDGWDGYGELELQIAADDAVAFGGTLADPAKELGGELVSSVRDGEDLTEQIIDSEARLQSRLLLREKLTTILRNNRGSVAELIKAEQAIADVNEEIDSTRSKMQRLQNRVRYSAVRIEYEPYFGESQMGFRRPVITALQSIRSTLGVSVALIIYLITALVPIVLFILALRWVLHRFGVRMRFWRKEQKAEKAPEYT